MLHSAHIALVTLPPRSLLDIGAADSLAARSGVDFWRDVLYACGIELSGWSALRNRRAEHSVLPEFPRFSLSG